MEGDLSIRVADFLLRYLAPPDGCFTGFPRAREKRFFIIPETSRAALFPRQLMTTRVGLPLAVIMALALGLVLDGREQQMKIEVLTIKQL